MKIDVPDAKLPSTAAKPLLPDPVAQNLADDLARKEQLGSAGSDEVSAAADKQDPPMNSLPESSVIRDINILSLPKSSLPPGEEVQCDPPPVIRGITGISSLEENHRSIADVATEFPTATKTLAVAELRTSPDAAAATRQSPEENFEKSLLISRRPQRKRFLKLRPLPLRNKLLSQHNLESSQPDFQF
ncbi:OLC1v1015649C1 [Oldenlandia corymbosa var. corymbosa]|uniref:OLC1v1015649C1 n=1 Tax=Oldenlandia corymbosa var. corymbosa TaxID=529605 RepID=A0AAV1E3Z7_OLDCO|nr:OLC1v1015649C1 [Oldenlandia corymbosa var. corymbosa]